MVVASQEVAAWWPGKGITGAGSNRTTLVGPSNRFDFLFDASRSIHTWSTTEWKKKELIICSLTFHCPLPPPIAILFVSISKHRTGFKMRTEESFASVRLLQHRNRPLLLFLCPYCSLSHGTGAGLKIAMGSEDIKTWWHSALLWASMHNNLPNWPPLKVRKYNLWCVWNIIIDEKCEHLFSDDCLNQNELLSLEEP